MTEQIILKDGDEVQCDSCGGKGACPNCEGRGYIGERQYDAEWGEWVGKECDCCEGGACYTCSGYGYHVVWQGSLLAANHPVFN